jgi:probable F420-dependent oxidoreductase
MKLGFTTMNIAGDVPPAVLASGLEAAGYDSWFIGEHSHIPASRSTPYPGGGDMPSPYREMMDPFVSLAVAAGATTTLQLGLGVCLVLEHHVLQLAKSVATLDRISGGRVQFGVGVGWNAEELGNHRPDIPWARRYRATEEAVSALKACWTAPDASFHGEFFDFDAVWSEPKPLQQPHPPVLFGGSGRLAAEHTIRWGDGWMPMDSAMGYMPKRLERFHQAVADAGRAPIPVSVVLFGDPTAEQLHHYRDLGVYRAIIGSGRSEWEDPATVMPFMERWAPMVAELT